MAGVTLVTEEWHTFEALGRRRTYRAGRTLFRERDEGREVLAVRTGRIKIISHTPAGREVILAFKVAGEVVGEFSALDGRRRSATAVAVEPTEVLILSRDAFNTFLEEHPRFAVHLLRVLAAQVRATSRSLTERDAADVVSRVASRLAVLGEDVREHTGSVSPVIVSLTHDDLAAWIGASREATSRALARLRSAGLVTTGRHRITLRDPALLSRYGG